MVRRPTAADLAAWRDFRAALAELGQVDPERARLYLTSAAGGLRAWMQALRQHPPRPRGIGEPEGRQ